MKQPLPRWMVTQDHDHTTGSKRHELRIAFELGGRRLPRSGGTRRSRWDPDRSQGGDVETENLLAECKHTKQSAFRLDREVFAKVEDGARRRGKLPVIVLTFESHEGPLDLALLRFVDLRRLLEKRRAEEAR